MKTKLGRTVCDPAVKFKTCSQNGLSRFQYGNNAFKKVAEMALT